MPPYTTYLHVCHDSFVCATWLIQPTQFKSSCYWTTWCHRTRLIHMCAITHSYVRHDSFNQHNSNRLLTIQPDAMVRERMHTSRTWISVMSHVWMSHVTQLTSCHTSDKKELPLLLRFVKKSESFPVKCVIYSQWCDKKEVTLLLFFVTKVRSVFFPYEMCDMMSIVWQTLSLHFLFVFFCFFFFSKQSNSFGENPTPRYMTHIYMCAVNHSRVRHDSFMCGPVTWRTCSYVCHDSFVCVTWRVHMGYGVICDMSLLLMDNLAPRYMMYVCWSKETPPPGGGCPIYMFSRHELWVRGPPLKHLIRILRGGSSYSRFLMREHNR